MTSMRLSQEWTWIVRSGAIRFGAYAPDANEAVKQFAEYVRRTGIADRLGMIIRIARDPLEPWEINMAPEKRGYLSVTSLFMVDRLGYSLEEVALFETRWMRAQGFKASYEESLARLREDLPRWEGSGG